MPVTYQDLMKRTRRLLDDRLQPSYLTAVAGIVVTLGLVLAAILFVTSNRGQTAFGIPLGADFSGFYVAAKILNQGKTAQLYDRQLHDQLYHELLPHEDARVSIPYVHPPFVAGLLRPIARQPYPVAVGIWLVISASLYLVSIWLTLTAVPWQRPPQRWLIILLAASFEPFLFECWLGGQLSAIACCSYSLCFVAMQRGKPFWAGMALGICFYKPTLLLLMLPMLVVGRQWKIVGGMTCTGLALAVLSLVMVGWEINAGYVNVLLSFQKSASGSDLEIRTWKYVDLNNCLRMILGAESPLRLPLLALVGFVPVALLAKIWWRVDQLDNDRRRFLWATTLTWVPVLNLYVGIYDSILVVQSLLITAAAICERSKESSPLLSSGFAYLVLAISVAPWFSQNVAATTGISVYTLLLMGFGLYQFGCFFGWMPWFGGFPRRFPREARGE